MKILIVCTGNTCRSPMGEGLLKKALPGFNISSAGVYAAEGVPANPNAIAAAKELGIDISNHLSRRLTKELISESDLILCMTEGHKDAINSENCFTMGEYADTDEEVADPFGGEAEEYRQCISQMAELVNKIADKIKNENNSF